MSRSRPTVKNPSTRFIQWGGAKGELNYWDKENEQQVLVPFPFTFLVLDELNTVTGYSDADKKGFYSNEVRNITKDILNVKVGTTVKGSGTWKQLEGLKGQGAKYAKSIYIAYKDETGELVIGNLRVSGAALTAWIEFNKKWNVEKCAVTITGRGDELKKGATVYYAPQFEGKAASDATNAAATDLDDQLQAYLDTYLNQRTEVEAEIVEDDFEEEEAAPAPAAQVKREAAPVEDDAPLDLSDVPF